MPRNSYWTLVGFGLGLVFFFWLCGCATGKATTPTQGDTTQVVWHGTKPAEQTLYVCGFMSGPNVLDCVSYAEFLRAQ